MNELAVFPPLCFAAPGQGGFGPPPQGGYGGAPGGYGPPGGFGAPPGGFGGGPGNYPPPPPIRQMHTMAVVSLVAGIVSWFMCPFVGGIVALICGQMARNAIRAEPNKWDGNGMAVGGMIAGGINVGLYVLFGLFYLLIIILGVGAAVLGS